MCGFSWWWRKEKNTPLTYTVPSLRVWLCQLAQTDIWPALSLLTCRIALAAEVVAENKGKHHQSKATDHLPPDSNFNPLSK